MAKPSPETVQAQIDWLEENRDKIPQYNAFAESLQDKIDAELEVLKEDLSEDDIYDKSVEEEDADPEECGRDWSHAQRNSALDVRQWLDGECDESPEDNWTPLIGWKPPELR